MKEDFSFGPISKVSPKRHNTDTQVACSKRIPEIENLDDMYIKNKQEIKKIVSHPCFKLEPKVIEDRSMNLTSISPISSEEVLEIPDSNQIITKSSLNIKSDPNSRISSITAFKVDNRECPAVISAPDIDNKKRSTYYQLLKAGKTE